MKKCEFKSNKEIRKESFGYLNLKNLNKIFS
jgi:hypothetical protein